MKTKDILYEWKSFLRKEMISEISIKKFKERHPEFDTTNFTSQLSGNTDYLDIINNSIVSGQQHSPDDYLQQFEFYKNSIEPNRNSQVFLTVNIPGEADPVSLVDKVTQGSCTATFNDIQQFQQARMFALGKGSKNKLAASYTKVLEEASQNDFELIVDNNDWAIYYPKSIRGSIALARSYWDGSKISYDTTFNPSKGFGKNTGEIGWCTSVSGAGNMFLNYHRKLNLHMYYCIKKSISSIKDPDRKLCISFSKNTKQDPPIQFNKGHSSVNGDNINVSEEYSKNKLGSLFDNLLKDVAESKRLEIDIESYYKSISIDQYIIMRNANEENISDFQNEVFNILQYSKDSNKIIYHIAKDSHSEIRIIAVNHDNIPPEVLSYLSKDEDADIRREVARNPNTPPETLSDLSKDEDEWVIINVARNNNTPPEVLSDFAQDENVYVRTYVAGNRNTPPEFLLNFAKDDSKYIRMGVARNPNAPPEVLSILAKDSDATVRYDLASNNNTPPEVLSTLVKDSDATVRNRAIKSLENIKNESILRAYIKLITS